MKIRSGPTDNPVGRLEQGKGGPSRGEAGGCVAIACGGDRRKDTLGFTVAAQVIIAPATQRQQVVAFRA